MNDVKSQNLDIVFSGDKRNDWLETVSKFRKRIKFIKDAEINVYINDISEIDQLEPFHLVLLACLRQDLKDKGNSCCYLKTENRELSNFLFNDINLGQYWLGKQPENHTESSDETIFNLWRVLETEKESYSEHVHSYLKRKFFKHKDLSAIKLSLLEIFYNIFDHAEAKGNAFSLVKYNKNKNRLYVAVCDFGKGIASTIRYRYKDIGSDKEAILKATEDSISAKSRDHNRGMGIGNVIDILGEGDTLRILSNSGFLYVTDDFKRTFQLKNEFKGTLIYFDVSLSNFEDENILDNFDLENLY